MNEKPEALRLVNVSAVEKELRRLHAENERLREMVSRWAAHHRGCGMIIGNLCNCGLDTAIDALRGEET